MLFIQTIPRYTVIVGSSTKNNQTAISTLLSHLSEAHDQLIQLDQIEKSTDCKWINYVKGVISLFPCKLSLLSI